MRDFKRLKIWQQAHQLARNVYTATTGFPESERYGLTSQLRRSTTSIASNIAEGCGRNTVRELRRFAVIARGSASECEYQLILSLDLGYLSSETCLALLQDMRELQRMLGAFIRSLSRQIAPVDQP